LIDLLYVQAAMADRLADADAPGVLGPALVRVGRTIGVLAIPERRRGRVSLLDRGELASRHDAEASPGDGWPMDEPRRAVDRGDD
jgi:hypothetical protein